MTNDLGPMSDPAAPARRAEKPVRVAVVEDDAGLRDSINAILARDLGCEPVGSFGTAEAAIARIPKLEADVVIVDINLPGVDGVECVRRLSALCPQTHFLVLTVFKDTDRIFAALAAGAVGYLLKPVPPDRLTEAIRDVYAGGAPITSSIARKLVTAFQRSPRPVDMGVSLSPREQEVLEMLSRGLAYKEIAKELGISYRTVHTHLEHIYQKLHVSSRAEAVARFLGRR